MIQIKGIFEKLLQFFFLKNGLFKTTKTKNNKM